jgi:hypothetical protein
MSTQHTSPPARPARKRPAIVTIIIVVFILETISAAVVTLIYAAEAGVFSQQIAQTIRVELSDVQLPDAALYIRVIASGLLLIANLFTTIGLIRMRSWAWTSAMVLMGIRLAFGLSDYLFGSPAFDLLIFCVVLVFLLNQHEVRKAFGIIKETHVSAQPIKRANDAIRR